MRYLLLALLLISSQAYSSDSSSCSSQVYLSIVGGTGHKVANVGNQVCLKNSIFITFPGNDGTAKETGYLDFDQSIVWRVGIRPKKFHYSDARRYIHKLNKEDKLKEWRLPNFDELSEFRKVIKTKNNRKIKLFSELEVWAEPEDGEPAFYNLELGNRYSGTKFTKKRYLLLVSAND